MKNDQVNPDAANGVPKSTTESGGSGSTHCSAIFAIKCDEELPPPVIGSETVWGYGVDLVKGEAQDINSEPVDMRWQQTGPKEGHWVKTENLTPYLGDQ